MFTITLINKVQEVSVIRHLKYSRPIADTPSDHVGVTKDATDLATSTSHLYTAYFRLPLTPGTYRGDPGEVKSGTTTGPNRDLVSLLDDEG